MLRSHVQTGDITEGSKSSFVDQRESSKHSDVVQPKLHNPTSSLPMDHACKWRTRCMDLSSEIEQFKSSARSHDVVEQGSQTQTAGHIDVGVGDSRSRRSSRQCAIEGLTIVLHMRGKDDLVINADLEKDL